MKTPLILLSFLFLILLSSCRKSKVPSDETSEGIDTFPTATAIFWVDKDKKGHSTRRKKPLPIRTVKAKVDIDTAGKVKLLSYAKPQKSSVQKYLQSRLEVFRVTKIMLDSGFVKLGEQYVQLRYIPGKVK